jgi:hypothetical protein
MRAQKPGKEISTTMEQRKMRRTALLCQSSLVVVQVVTVVFSGTMVTLISDAMTFAMISVLFTRRSCYIE